MKSECREHQNRIAALALGELDEKEKQSLEAHMAVCRHCRSEQGAYARTVQRLAATADEEIPHHFFLYPEPQPASFWQLFLRMPLRWQAAAVGFSMIVLLVCVAAISRVHIRSDSSGWAVSFGGHSVDVAALRTEILDAAERKQQESALALIRDMRNEIGRSNTNLTQQQVRLTKALERMDSRLSGRISSTEDQVREDARILVAELYRTIARQRSQDLELINLRIDNTEVMNAIKAQQTDEILGTLLQVADGRLGQ